MKVLEIAPLIGQHLKDWRYNAVLSQESEWRPIAVFTNDKTKQRFSMSQCWRDPKRLQFFGNHSQEKITVSSERDPKAIAGDVARRFLPGFVRDQVEYEARELQRQETAREYAQKIHLLESILGELKQYRSHDPIRFDGGSINFCYDNTVEITFRRSFDDVVKLAIFGAELEKEHA